MSLLFIPFFQSNRTSRDSIDGVLTRAPIVLLCSEVRSIDFIDSFCRWLDWEWEIGFEKCDWEQNADFGHKVGSGIGF